MDKKDDDLSEGDGWTAELEELRGRLAGAVHNPRLMRLAVEDLAQDLTRIRAERIAAEVEAAKTATKGEK